MQISTKGRYALCFLVDLAQHRNCGPVALKDTAARQQISKKYLEHVIALLSPTGMLQVTRGYMGGYQLACNPAQITVAQVLSATEGGLDPVPAQDIPTQSPEAALLPLWNGLGQVIEDYLSGITVQDLADQITPGIEYYI